MRRIWVSGELKGYIDFPYHEQVVRIERISTDLLGRKRRGDVAFGITSLKAQVASPSRLLALNRGHWSIENRLHWVRDVTFGEDKSPIRTKSAPRVLATLRNPVISLLRLTSIQNIARALRYFAAKPHLSIALIGL